MKKYGRNYWKTHPEYAKENTRKHNERRFKKRLRCLIHYSGDPPKCACCGESHIEFLTIDHIHGGGTQHRKKISNNIHRWLIKNNFPDGFQVLCWNCNCAKGKNKQRFCPVHHPELY